MSVLSEPLHFILLRNLYQQVNCRIHGKIANIKPLFKKCSKTDKKNYRQISLRSLVCKLTGKIVKSRAMKFWRNIHIPFPNQFGSMAGRSTPSELLSCYDDWTKWRDGRKPTDIVFLDFSTPSDSVPHKRLLFKQERQLALTAVFFSTCSHLFNWRHAAIRPGWYMLVMVSYFIGSTQGNNSRTVGISVICFLLKPTSIRRTHPIKRTRTPKWMLFWQFIYCFKPLFSGHLNKPRKGHLFRLQVYERVGISLFEVCMYERVGKSVIWVC